MGATSGIGNALARKLLDAGIAVIGVGRRQEQLDEFVKTSGPNAHASQFDITDISSIPGWAASIHQTHPDLDFVWINSGIQRGFNFAKPNTVRSMKSVNSNSALLQLLRRAEGGIESVI